MCAYIHTQYIYIYIYIYIYLHYRYRYMYIFAKKHHIIFISFTYAIWFQYVITVTHV